MIRNTMHYVRMRIYYGSISNDGACTLHSLAVHCTMKKKKHWETKVFRLYELGLGLGFRVRVRVS